MLVIIGFSQVATYYLSGSHPWIIILSFGLAAIFYLLPLSAVFLPLNINKGHWNNLRIFKWSLLTSATPIWALFLLSDISTKIYTDENGSNFYYGNLLLKQIGGISYLLLVLLVIFIIIVKNVAASSKKNKQQILKHLLFLYE